MASQTDEPVEQTFEKEVNLIAYADDSASRLMRNWVEQITGVDVTSYETVTETTWQLKADFGGSLPLTRSLSSHYVDEQKIKKQKKKFEKADADVTLTSEKSRKKEYENTLNEAAIALLKEIKEEFPVTINETFTREVYGSSLRWKDDVGNTAITISAPDWGERKVLAKEADRTDDSLYSTLTERNSAQFNITMQAESEEGLDELTETIVTTLHKTMSGLNGVGKVRYMECEVVTRKTGECYNI